MPLIRSSCAIAAIRHAILLYGATLQRERAMAARVKLLLCAFLVLGAPSLFACSFVKIGETQITVTEPDGTTYTWIRSTWAWVNCGDAGGGGSGGGGTYDPNPPPGTVGPPAPPPPPSPPSTDRCTICQDACWGEYALCMSDEQNTNWLGFCGILCRESCRVARDVCLGDDCLPEC